MQGDITPVNKEVLELTYYKIKKWKTILLTKKQEKNEKKIDDCGSNNDSVVRLSEKRNF